MGGASGTQPLFLVSMTFKRLPRQLDWPNMCETHREKKELESGKEYSILARL